MKKRLLVLTSTIEVTLFLVGVYFEPTHVVRGWLWGESLYEGRPTSYWRVRCDRWLERFDTAEDAARWIPPGISVPMIGDNVWGDFRPIRPAPQTWWTRLLDRLNSDQDRWQADWPPRVLFGYPGAEPVLEELAREPKYRALAERALLYAKVYRGMGHTE